MADKSLTQKDGVTKLSGARQIFLYVGSFPALTFFTIWASFGRGPCSLLTAACAMLIYCAFVLALAKHWDKPTYFDWAVCAYFLVCTVSLSLWPDTTGAILADYTVTGIYLCLFAAAFFPPLFGFDPFSYHYAKKYVPRDVWGSAIFVTINRIITLVWSGIFATCVASSLYASVATRAIIPFVLMVGVGLPFNLRFADYYLRRLGLPGLKEMQKSGSADKNGTDLVSDTGADAGHLAAAIPERSRVQVAAEEPRVQSGQENRSQSGKENTMKVIAINSSPRGDGTSKTGMMLDALVEGMRDAGAEVEMVHLRKKTVKNCIGCYTCWTKTPGVCVHKDDMTGDLFPKWLEADIAVYATPLYHFTVNASLKAFIERTLPVLLPFLQRSDGGTHHPLRQKPPKAVVLSVAGFPEPSVFAQLSSYVKLLYGKGLMAEIYRPGSEAMSQPEFSETTRGILEATTQGGRELIQSGTISAATMEGITQSIGGDFDSFAKIANLFWKSCIQEGVTPFEFRQRNMVPRPDSIETFMMIMSRGFNPGPAGNTRAVIQFKLSGEANGACYFRIEGGKIEAVDGVSEKPDLVIESPFDIWMDVMTGKADGQQMFMQQKYKAVGDLSLLIRMKDLFGNPEGA